MGVGALAAALPARPGGAGRTASRSSATTPSRWPPGSPSCSRSSATGRRRSRERDRGQARFQTDIMVVFDGSRKLRSLPGVIQVLREGPPVGVYAVCLDADERLLPAECQAVAVVEPDGLRVQQMMAATIREVRPDHVSPGWCARLARAMAPIRDVSDNDDAAGLPDSSRLLDVLRLEPPTAEAIAARWRGAAGPRSPMVGESYDGPFGIDVRKDGPHGLIAGTTGSGKSELLQTIVASLAVANRPDEMTFVLVDYKGGSAFKDCVQLPHTVGMVTDLDTHQVERALVSLSAELTRREHILAAAGAKDIEDYQMLVDTAARAGAEPLPRLLIVIDEFASMVRDLPDFVTGLVNIAQRGRSLGIHLHPRHPAALRGGVRGHPGQHQPADRPAGHRPRRERRRDRRAGRGAHLQVHAGARLRPARARLADPVSGRAGRRAPAGGRRRRSGAGHGWRRSTGRGLGRPEPARPAARQRAEEEITDLKVLVEQISGAVRGLRIPAPAQPLAARAPGVRAARRHQAAPAAGASAGGRG